MTQGGWDIGYSPRQYSGYGESKTIGKIKNSYMSEQIFEQVRYIMNEVVRNIQLSEHGTTYSYNHTFR